MTPRMLTAQEWRVLTAQEWRAQQGDLLGLWTGAGRAFALFAPGILSAIALTDGAYPALSPDHPGAAWFERLAYDLNGHTAVGAIDTSPAIAQGRDAAGRGAWPDFRPGSGAGAHAIAIGPASPGIAAPALFYLTLRGDSILGLQTRLGYAHRGILALVQGKSPRLAARYAARVSGDATVAHSLAFAHAAEGALEVTPPPRAIYLRAVMAELERIASHAGVLGDVMQRAGFLLLAARCQLIRESIAAAALAAFGHRLMMDCVIPGGVAGDLRTGGAAAISSALAEAERALPDLGKSLEFNGFLRDRLAGIGIIPPGMRAPGPAGRAAAGRADCRHAPGYAPYQTLDMQIPSAAEGDAAARMAVRLAELAESIRLIRRLLHELPEGHIAVAPPAGSGEGIGASESSRGAVWVWLSITGGAITGAFIADPGALLFPLLEHMATAAALAGFGLMLASIDPSACGVDL